MSDTSPWKPHGMSITGDECLVYVVADQGADATIHLGNQAVLAVKTRGDLIDFAVFEWHYSAGSSEPPGTPPAHTLLFHGSGVSGALRECRHTYWGEDGYVHYLNFAVVEAAFRELRRWFDGA